MFPTDVSQKENSWILCPLYCLFLELVIPELCVSTLDGIKELVITSQFVFDVELNSGKKRVLKRYPKYCKASTKCQHNTVYNK